MFRGIFGASHASTIVEVDSGKFIVAWFAGTYEGANDVCIWASKFNGNDWSEPNKIASGIDSIGNQLPCWNPVLLKTENQKLFLFYKVGLNPREWWGRVLISNDLGKSWEKPVNLPIGYLGPIKNKPIQLSDGKILCPSSVEELNGNWKVHIEITDENLSYWKKNEIDKDSIIGVIQPTIINHSNETLQILCRSRQNSIFESWSFDNGKSWTKLSSTNIPNPNSGFDAVALKDGRFLLVYNPLLQGKEWSNGRNILNVAISSDGKIWKDIFQLENENNGEFSYPQ
ncbi:MAG: exo-alpha-sialidase [Ignavibacteriales bacterium]|nr:exo-alpha-sialidase [Ignavibacteriales bacterium]